MGYKPMKKLLLAIAVSLLCSCVAVVEDWGEAPRYVTFESSEATQGETSLNASVELNIGSLEIQSGDASQVYGLEVYYNEAAFSPKVDFQRNSGDARLRFELSGEGKFASRVGKTRVSLKLNPETPLQLEAKTGVGESDIDLSGMKIEDMRLETGVGETHLAMLTPNRVACRRLDLRSGVGELEVKGVGNFGFDAMLFEGGVGSATLDFSGEWETVGDIEVRVGVGGVELQLPRSLGAEVRSTKSFLSGIDLTEFTQEGDVFRSNNIKRVSKVLRIKINAGIGGVNIRWI